MKAIFAAILFTTLASPALAKPVTKAAPPKKAEKVEKVERHHRVAIEKLDTLGGLEQLDSLDVAVEAPELATAIKAEKGDAVGKLDLGLEYGLKKREAALPSVHVEDFEAKSLTEKQVGVIVRERAEDLEYCWLRLPPSKRVVSAAILHLNIEASGKVAAVEVNGDLPAGVGKCITQMAGRWVFPAADAPSVIDHGIMLTTASQKTR